MQIIEAGAFTITTGIHRGAERVFVTHNRTGKQWVRKDESLDTTFLPDLIQTGVIKFHLTGTDERSGMPRPTCDTRFWEPVLAPVAHPRSEFDALCFIGD